MKNMDAIKVLKKEFNENLNSHVFLVETDNLDACLADIKSLIKEIIKADAVTSHQIDEESFLELVVVKPIDKDIKKDQILALQERLRIKPVISEHVIYIISPADKLNEIAANKLLKTIEEPYYNTIGFLITDNSDLLLPTIKSRCEKVSMLYEDKNVADDTKEETRTFVNNIINAIEERDYLEFTRLKMEYKTLKEDMRHIENILKSYYNTACKFKGDNNLDEKLLDKLKINNSEGILIKKAQYLSQKINKLSKNMNADLLLDKIFFELKDVT